MKIPLLHWIFYIAFFITLVISGYIFVAVLIFKKHDKLSVFTTWQFPMLFALFVDLMYYNPEIQFK